MASSTTTVTTSVLCFDNTVSAKTMKNIFLKENYADFHFLFNEGGVQKRVPAHKAILAAASDVFATMMNGQWMEQNETEIPDASSDVFIEFLQFLYLPQVKVSAENISEVINLGNKYNVRECMELCGQQIKQHLTLDDVCTGLDLALQFDLDELKDHCLAEISEETSKVLATEEFLRCSKYSLKNILALDDVDCNDEIKIFNASLNWAKRTCEAKNTDPSIIANVREELGDCLYAIRFGVMTTEEIKSCVEKYDGLFNRIELEDLFLTIGEGKFQGQIFKNIVERTQRWRHDKILKFNLFMNNRFMDTTRRNLKLIESTTFQVSKRLLFGSLYLGAVLDCECPINIEVRLSVFEITHGTQKEILCQSFQTGTVRVYSKLQKAIRVKANTQYRVYIKIFHDVSNFYFYGSTIGPNQQLIFGDGIIFKTGDECSSFIKALQFNW